MKILLVPLGLALLLAVLAQAWLGREEPLTPLAREWDRLPPPVLAAADNAWFWLEGQGAAADEEPVAYAQRRLAAYEARVALGPAPWRDAELRRIVADPVPVVDTGDDISAAAAAGCPVRELDCIEWAGLHQASLDALERANEPRLARYQRTLAIAGFEDRGSPSLVDPAVPSFDIRIPRLHLGLIARDVLRGTQAPDELLARLRPVNRFWLGVGLQGHDLRAKLMADYVRERSWHLAFALLRLHPELADSVRAKALFEELWAPTDARYTSLAGEARRMHLSLLSATEELLNPGGVPPACWQLAPGDCLESVYMRAGFAPQATRNLSAQTFQWIERVAQARADQLEGELERSRAPLQALHPVLDGDFVSLFRLGNPTGRVLTAIAIPAYAPYLRRRHDHEGARRAFQAAWLARSGGTPTARMRAFLASQPAARRDPYSAQPFGWNARMGEIEFAAQGDPDWPVRVQVASAGLRGKETLSVRACPHPTRIELQARNGRTALLLACGPRGEAHLVGLLHAEADEPWPEYDLLLAAADAGGATLRVGLRDDDHVPRYYEAADLVVDGPAQILRALGRTPGEAELAARARREDGPPLLEILVPDLPVNEVWPAVVRASGIALMGTERMCDERIKMNFDAIPVEELLKLLGDACGASLSGDAAQGYHFGPYPPDA